MIGPKVADDLTKIFCAQSFNNHSCIKHTGKDIYLGVLMYNVSITIYYTHACKSRY